MYDWGKKRIYCDICGKEIEPNTEYLHDCDGGSYCCGECGNDAGVCDESGSVSEDDYEDDVVYWTEYQEEDLEEGGAYWGYKEARE